MLSWSDLPLHPLHSLARLLLWMGADPAKSNTFGCHGKITALKSSEEKQKQTRTQNFREQAIEESNTDKSSSGSLHVKVYKQR